MERVGTAGSRHSSLVVVHPRGASAREGGGGPTLPELWREPAGSGRASASIVGMGALPRSRTSLTRRRAPTPRPWRGLAAVELAPCHGSTGSTTGGCSRQSANSPAELEAARYLTTQPSDQMADQSLRKLRGGSGFQFDERVAGHMTSWRTSLKKRRTFGSLSKLPHKPGHPPGHNASQVAVRTIKTKMTKSVRTWAIQGASNPPDRSRMAPRSMPYTKASPTPTGP